MYWLVESFSLLAILATAAIALIQARASDIRTSMDLARRRIEPIRLDQSRRSTVDRFPMKIEGMSVSRSVEDIIVLDPNKSPTHPYLSVIFSVPIHRYPIAMARRAEKVGKQIGLALASKMNEENPPPDDWWTLWNAASADAVNWARLRRFTLAGIVSNWVAAGAAGCALASQGLHAFLFG